MAIDYSKIKGLTARELIRALLQDGFFFVHQKGSHRRYHHSDGRRVTMPFTRTGDGFAIGTLKSIIEKQSCWNEDDLKRLRDGRKITLAAICPFCPRLRQTGAK